MRGAIPDIAPHRRRWRRSLAAFLFVAAGLLLVSTLGASDAHAHGGEPRSAQATQTSADAEAGADVEEHGDGESTSCHHHTLPCAGSPILADTTGLPGVGEGRSRPAPPHWSTRRGAMLAPDLPPPRS